MGKKHVACQTKDRVIIATSKRQIANCVNRATRVTRVRRLTLRREAQRSRGSRVWAHASANMVGFALEWHFASSSDGRSLTSWSRTIGTCIAYVTVGGFRKAVR